MNCLNDKLYNRRCLMKILIAKLDKEIITPSDNCPNIFIICGPCRSGTTAFANNFVIAGIESHMQPIKSILREQLLDKPTIPNQILFQDKNIVLVKETFGAEKELELFNPIQILIEAGYPATKINVVGMVREPIATYNSWERLWGEVNKDIFEGSYRLMTNIKQYCAQNDVTYLSYVPEIIAHNNPSVVLQAVSNFFNFSLSLKIITKWKNQPKFGDQDNQLNHLHFYDKPPKKFIEGVRNWGGYVYRDTVVRCDYIVPEIAFAVYKEHQIECEKKLHMKV